MAGKPRERRRLESEPEEPRRLSAKAATWLALEELARDLGFSLDEVAEEAFSELLRKHCRPRSLREALRASARQYPAND